MAPQTITRQAPPNFTLWMERQFSGGEIGKRMIAAARAVGTDLEIISTPKQKMDTRDVEAYPYFKEGQPAVDEANRVIDKYGIDALWVRQAAQYPDALAQLSRPAHISCTPSVFHKVDNKAMFLEELGDDPARPKAVQVIGVRELVEAYGMYINEWGELCVKPVIGVNGSGYWHLTHEDSLIFSDPDRRRMPPEAYFTGLGIDPNSSTPLLLGEWLPGPEVSIDILCWEGEPLIHACRTKKIDRDAQHISSNHSMIEHARMLARKFKFHGIISVQYRKDKDGNWKILEINCRPAGGSINSEDAGFGIITGWTLLLIGAARPEDIKQVHDSLTIEFDRVARIVR